MLKVVVTPSQNEGFYNRKHRILKKFAVVTPSQNEGFYNAYKRNLSQRLVVIPSQNEGFYNGLRPISLRSAGCYTLSK